MNEEKKIVPPGPNDPPSEKVFPAGWYDDYADETKDRYWDGKSWTYASRIKKDLVKDNDPAISLNGLTQMTKMEKEKTMSSSVLASIIVGFVFAILLIAPFIMLMLKK